MSSHRIRSRPPANTHKSASQSLILQAIKRISEFNPHIRITLSRLLTYFEEVHSIRNGPATKSALKKTLSGMSTRGILTEFKEVGEKESSYSLKIKQDLHPGLAIKGQAVDRTKAWPTGNSLPGATSLICRPARNFPSSIRSPRSLMSMPSPQIEPPMPSYLSGEGSFLKPEMNLKNIPRKSAFTQSFGQRAGLRKNDISQRPNTPEENAPQSVQSFDKYFSSVRIPSKERYDDIKPPPATPAQDRVEEKPWNDPKFSFDNLNFEYPSLNDKASTSKATRLATDLSKINKDLQKYNQPKTKETFESFDKFLKEQTLSWGDFQQKQNELAERKGPEEAGDGLKELEKTMDKGELREFLSSFSLAKMRL